MSRLVRHALLMVLPLAVLAACSDRPSPPASAPSTTPAPTPPASPPPASSSAPVVPPQSATDPEKKGTETGMIGGASGDTASGGKPGSGTASGAGTGPAVSSGEKTENKK